MEFSNLAKQHYNINLESDINDKFTFSLNNAYESILSIVRLLNNQTLELPNDCNANLMNLSILCFDITDLSSNKQIKNIFVKSSSMFYFYANSISSLHQLLSTNDNDTKNRLLTTYKNVANHILGIYLLYCSINKCNVNLIKKLQSNISLYSRGFFLMK